MHEEENDHPTVHQILGEDGRPVISMIHLTGDREEAAEAIRECYATYHQCIDDAVESLVDGRVLEGLSRLQALADVIYKSVEANIAQVLLERSEELQRRAKNN